MKFYSQAETLTMQKDRYSNMIIQMLANLYIDICRNILFGMIYRFGCG